MEYTDLDVWQEARKLAAMVYRLTGQFPRDELFALTSQLRRAVVSISSNIAEGCGRSTTADTLRFLAIARGSAYEVESQLYICLDLGYCSNEQLLELLAQLRTTKRLLNGFINYYKSLLAP